MKSYVNWGMISKGLLYILLLGLFAWTVSLTMAFIEKILPELPYAKYFAIAVFDGAAIIWLILFMKDARGKNQKTITLTMTIVTLLGAAMMGLAEVYFGGQEFVQIPENLGMIALWVIIGTTVANIFAGFAYHIMDPKQQQEMAKRGAKDAIIDEALDQLDEKKQAMASGVAHQLSSRWANDILYELTAAGVTPENVNGHNEEEKKTSQSKSRVKG